MVAAIVNTRHPCSFACASGFDSYGLGTGSQPLGIIKTPERTSSSDMLKLDVGAGSPTPFGLEIQRNLLVLAQPKR